MAFFYSDLPFDLIDGADPEGFFKKQKKEIDNKKLYDILEVKQDATQNQIKKAYQLKARSLHPDKGGDKLQFQEIQEAYEVLGDPDKRKQYDEFGIDGVKKDAEPNGENLFDLLLGKEKKQKVQKMDPIKIEKEFQLEDSYNGKSLNIVCKRKRLCQDCQGWGGKDLIQCKECDGSGMKEVVKNVNTIYQTFKIECDECQTTGKIYEKKSECKNCKGEGIVESNKDLQIYVEKGSYDGQLMTLYGEGNEKLNIMAGDVIVKLKQLEHKKFTRKGADLYMNLDIELKYLFSQCQKEVEHLDKKGDIKSYEQKMMVVGKGMPFYGDQMSHGNLIITFVIQFPKQLTGNEVDGLSKILSDQIFRFDNKVKMLELQDDKKDKHNPNPEGGEIKEEQGNEPKMECAQQ